jgi:RND family efflux transporter MFP subunit
MRLATRLLTLVLVLALAGGAWWWRTQRPVPVTVAELRRGEAAEVVYATGAVEPERWAEVTPLSRARIVETCGCEGETVERGAALFRLDDVAARAHLAELRARLDLAEKSLARVEPLLTRDVVSRDRYDAALAQAAELRAGVAVAENAIENLLIRSPLDGVVLRLDGEVGEVAEPGEALAWVGSPAPLLVVAEVNEEDIPRVEPGQRALLKADAFPGRALEATVASITPKGDPALRTYRVRLALPADTPLRIGMSVEVNIVIRTVAGALLAPAAAVLDGAVQAVEAGRLRREPVSPGIVGAVTVELTEGGAEGMTVVNPARADLDEGRRVRIETRPTPHPALPPP